MFISFCLNVNKYEMILSGRHAYVKKLSDFHVGNFFVFCSRYQCGNMAREGLRVLVVAKKSLTEEQYQDFEVSFQRLVIRKFAVEQNPGVNNC